MKLSSVVSVIDAHTEGQPMRIITSGFPTILGKTIHDKYAYVEENLEDLRQMVLYEPRGRRTMCGAFLVEPTVPDADVGVIFIEPIGLVPMCGHGAIAIAKILVETNRVKVSEPSTHVRLDTIGGVVDMAVKVKDGDVGEITLRNVESFSYMRDVNIQTDRFGDINVDLAYGGTFYAIVSAKDVGLEIVPKETREIVKYGEILRESIQEQVKIMHPKGSSLAKVLQIQFTAPPTHPNAHMKNVVIVPPAGIDRSPCGTGTSARMADLFAKGELHIGDEFVHESIIGTLFRGKIIGESREGGYPAIIPEVTGKAYVTGFQQLVVEDEDPFKRGFILA